MANCSVAQAYGNVSESRQCLTQGRSARKASRRRHPPVERGAPQVRDPITTHRKYRR
jgi:hypothetical protein